MNSTSSSTIARNASRSRSPIAAHACLLRSNASDGICRLGPRRALHGGVGRRLLRLADRHALEGVRDRADEGAGGRLEDVRGDALATGQLSVRANGDAHLPERVGPPGDGLDLIALQL